MIEIMTIKQLDILQNQDTIFLLKIHIPHCSPCEALAKELQVLEDKFTDIGFYTINAARIPEVAHRFKIMSVPYIVIFQNKNIVHQASGFVPKNSCLAIQNKLEVLKGVRNV